MAEVQWRPYRFQGLPKYTRESAALLARFQDYLGQVHFGARKLAALSAAAREIYKQPVSVRFEHLRVKTFSEWSAQVPEHAGLVRVGLLPHEEKVIWELDPVLAAGAVDRLLGGRGEDFGSNRPFTEVEEGVLTYALLKLVHGFGEGTELALRVENLSQSVEALRGAFSEDLLFYALSFRVGVGPLAAYSRVYIPHTLARGVFALPPDEENADVLMQRMRRNLQRVGEQWVLARVAIATIDLDPEDREALDVGDIVLLEHHDLSGSGEALQGHAFVRLGRGKNGGLKTQLIWRGGRLDIQITDVVLEEEPQTMGDEISRSTAPQMPAGEAAEIEEGALEGGAQDRLADNEGLLRDVPAPVTVELGRLKMTTAQVIRLRPGQILRLGRGPSDPVDLVVNNRIFARGELIEVDGEIGVRLVQLAK